MTCSAPGAAHAPGAEASPRCVPAAPVSWHRRPPACTVMAAGALTVLTTGAALQATVWPENALRPAPSCAVRPSNVAMAPAAMTRMDSGVLGIRTYTNGHNCSCIEGSLAR